MNTFSKTLGAVIGLVMIGSVSAKAADPVYCNAYGSLAAAQYHMAVAKGLAVGFPRWNPDINAHSAWCMLPFVTRQQADAEIAARHSVIN